VNSKYAEASEAFRNEARQNILDLPKPPPDQPVGDRGSEYWSSVSVSNLVGESSAAHQQVTLRCGHRGSYVNGLTAHMGQTKYLEDGTGIGGIAIHCRPDTTSTRQLLRLDSHSIFAAGGSDFLRDMTDRNRSSGAVIFRSMRYMAYRNTVYSNGIAIPYRDTFRRGQERLCGPGFSLQGFGSTARDSTILRDLVDLECRDLSALPALATELQGFDLTPVLPNDEPMLGGYANCGGEQMVGVVVHLNPLNSAISGIEPLCGGYDTVGITL
jgi:hypothetical protein